MPDNPRATSLNGILAVTRSRVAALQGRAKQLERAAAAAPAPRPFPQPGPTVGVIAEVKRRSPSQGAIREDLDPVAHADAYERGGAVAVSVLTDEAHFGGSIDDLRRVSASISVPVLRKDFVIHKVQIPEARAAGASAVLLIARVLKAAELKTLAAAVREWQMVPLIEVHTADELEAALDAGPSVLGVNARDLDSFLVDLGAAETLLARVPASVSVVAESGVETRTDVDRLSAQVGASVILKREDLNHTGAHKINNTLGQVLLAQRMHKRRIIAETGAGQHGVATATVCARFGLECVVYMGEEDMRRQRLNVYRMELMGARVVPVTSGSRTLKDATNEALRDWVTNVTTTHYIIGSVVGPDPFPRIVRDFQSVIGREARGQVLERWGRLPGTVVACVGGGSNAMGIFSAFLDDRDVALVGVEAAGEGVDTDRHAASLGRGRPGVFHGSLSYLLQSADGQVQPAHSVSAGLDYPGVGPEHAYLKDSGRVLYEAVTDRQALDAFATPSRLEGILPALESAHALAWVLGRPGHLPAGDVVPFNLRGRGGKDVAMVAELTGATL